MARLSHTSRLIHTLHICFRPHLWLLYIVSVVAAISIAAASSDWLPRMTQSYLMGYFEIYGTIAVVLGLHHVLTVDGDERALEVLMTYPTSRLLLAGERIVAGFLLSAGPFLVLAGGYYVFLRASLSEQDFSLISMKTVLIDSTASWVFLGGLALLASVLTGNWLSGLLVGGFYWIADLVSYGRFTSNLFLFQGTFTPLTVSPETNRLLLSGLGMLLCIAAALMYGRFAVRR